MEVYDISHLMKIRRIKLTDQLRRAINASGVSRYSLCQRINLSQSTMSRFMSKAGGLSMEMLDRIGDSLDLNIVSAKAPRRDEGG
jgi:transcriptional regulator with XRE-family HTH domain